ncbi:uncharacterized protein J7T54_000333 [Emericellopsis cladophorae]|uniref:PLD phosphodiesterase domain-containing protein n=1 Tax=Emericellopsis cladophorae TaxID=2686198 RepID=A0A9P9XWM5_9HYPO|nr:uncharacterized protein J7T54_000333 [Emericellopsis cladophorae]KAI6779187.1 hypothetical protein J7T54_000333 [Emericellopsis cladophorae]
MVTPENPASRPVGDMDDDEALEYAIALSMQDEEQPPSQQQQQQQPPLNQDEQPQAAEPSTSQNCGLAQLDRRAMEQERLKRIASKRPRPAADDDQDDVVEISPPAKKRAVSREPKVMPLQFPRGVVKKTWAYGYPRSADDIKIEEILQKDRLELALLSSFQWDDAWLMSKIDARKTKLILLAYAQNAAQQDMRENAPPRVRFCFPPMKGSGAMHSKLQLLKYPDSLRIVIPSGNLVPYDWGESGVMENMVFLIDLSRLSSASKHEETEFSQSLSRFLQEAGVDAKMIDSLRNYDFSETRNLGFVYTTPGGHAGQQQRENG